MRRWLVEETGEVRNVDYSEYFLSRSNDFLIWQSSHRTSLEYPILSVREISEGTPVDAEFSLGDMTKEERRRWIYGG